MHYCLRPIKGVHFGFANFASHFIRVQIFQIDFPLIISASKYFRQISLSFYICRGQNEQPAIPQIYLLGDEMNSCLKEGMESESEIINQIFGHHASSKKIEVKYLLNNFSEKKTNFFAIRGCFSQMFVLQKKILFARGLN